MSTLEAAIAGASVIVLTALMSTGIVTIAAQISAIDQANAAARAHAIGVPYIPSRGHIDVDTTGDMVTVHAHVGSPLGIRSAEASFPKEMMP